MRTWWLSLGLALAAGAARAQPSDLTPLAQLRSEQELARALATITQDPAVHAGEPDARPLAAALMTEGVKQLKSRAYEQALANFLEAYNRFPSPRLLLEIASSLRDMGRLADAANTYQRYLADPGTGYDRVAEVKRLLVELDRQLTVLTVRVAPKGSELSIDGGPFIPVGGTLIMRVRVGPHLVRIRNGDALHELSVVGFEGESKDVIAELTSPSRKPAPRPAPAPGPKPTPTAMPRTPGPPPDRVYGWLDAGTLYGTRDVTGRQRDVRVGYGGPVVHPIIPELSVETERPVFVEAHDGTEFQIRSGVIGLVRIDGKGRGLAGGLGVAFAPLDSVELELAALRSSQWGAYAGLRIRFMSRTVRPYVSGGLPAFLFENENDAMRTQVALGLRAAAGIELKLSSHLGVQGDLGIEHFFTIDDDALVGGKRPDRTVFVPTVGVIGRL